MAVNRYNRLPVLLMVLCFFFSSSCGSNSNVDLHADKEAGQGRAIKIGFSMDTLKEERWQRDRDVFVAKAKELGAEVIVQNANNDSGEQEEQVRYLLEQGIDVLVIVPHDAEKAASIVQMAKKEGVKVISYDRLVRNANVDLYISFDNVKVGELMAGYVASKVPTGNYVIVNGAKTDYNSYMYNKGYKNSLKTFIESGDITVINEVWAEDWMPEEASRCIEVTLREGKRIDAVIAANDSLAGAAIEALAEQRLAGQVAVAGHDADLAGCQRVVEGTQLITVYKPIDSIAKTAAEITIKVAKGEEISTGNSINDGKYDVPYYMIQPVPVTKENMYDTVIQDGFHRLEDVYRNVPETEWPSDRQ